MTVGTTCGYFICGSRRPIWRLPVMQAMGRSPTTAGRDCGGPARCDTAGPTAKLSEPACLDRVILPLNGLILRRSEITLPVVQLGGRSACPEVSRRRLSAAQSQRASTAQEKSMECNMVGEPLLQIQDPGHPRCLIVRLRGASCSRNW